VTGPRREVHLRRPLVAAMWTVAGPSVHIGLPWALSLLSSRHGWTESCPGAGNVLGLVPVVGGLACVAWCLALHFVRAPRGWTLEATPHYLVDVGPYRFSRNPMYVAALAIWFGWALFYGSVAVLVGACVLGAVVVLVVVPFEERRLEARFGDGYVRYRRRVPRWLGRRS